MIVIDPKTPIGIIDFEVICYCPFIHEAFTHGITLCQIQESEFLIGVLNFDPRERDNIPDSVFLPQNPGFIWKCPAAIQDKLSNKELKIKDVMQYWLLSDESLGIINTAFRPASLELLTEYFPIEDLVIYELNSTFLSEFKKIKDIPLRQSTFFKDQYEGQWIISRSNVSTLCLVQVLYHPETKALKLLSEAYLIDELVVVIMKQYVANPDWEELTLGELLKLKNLLHHRVSYESIPAPFQDCFQVYPLNEVKDWISSHKLNS